MNAKKNITKKVELYPVKLSNKSLGTLILDQYTTYELFIQQISNLIEVKKTSIIRWIINDTHVMDVYSRDFEFMKDHTLKLEKSTSVCFTIIDFSDIKKRIQEINSRVENETKNVDQPNKDETLDKQFKSSNEGGLYKFPLYGENTNTEERCNVNTEESLKTIQSHNNNHNYVVKCLIKLNDTTIESGSEDKIINSWNIITGECLKTYQAHKCYDRSLLKRNCHHK